MKAVHADAARTQTLASFTYDAGGNRLLKVAYATDGTTPTESTWYLRDGSGGVLSYTHVDELLQTTTEELPIAGVGSYLRASLKTRYEVSDHLGNTRVSFTTDGNGDVLVIEAHDYYPHGGLLPGRQLSGTGASPLAYQGQEYDPEVGLTAFNLRQYDGRIGRWLTTDPYGQHHSPYLAMSNNPVSFVDPDGGYDAPSWVIGESTSGELAQGALNEEQWNGGWTYNTLWLLMGGNQNMDDWMHEAYGAIPAEEFERGFNLSGYEVFGNKPVSENDWIESIAGREIQFIQSNLDQFSSTQWNTRMQGANESTNPESDNRVPFPIAETDLYGLISATMALQLTIIGEALNSSANYSPRYRSNPLNITMVGEGSSTAFAQAARNVTAVGAAYGTVDNYMQARNSHAQGKHNRGAINAVECSLYAAGGIMLFTPAAPIGIVLVGVLGGLDTIEYFYDGTRK